MELDDANASISSVSVLQRDFHLVEDAQRDGGAKRRWRHRHTRIWVPKASIWWSNVERSVAREYDLGECGVGVSVGYKLRYLWSHGCVCPQKRNLSRRGRVEPTEMVPKFFEGTHTPSRSTKEWKPLV